MSRFYFHLMGTTVFASVAVFGLSPACAADAKAEIKIAAQHAALAASSTEVATVHMHLHHAINCIEGPKGADFTTKELNPCQNTGNGAIPDSDNPTTNASLQTAVAHALAGLATNNLATAQSDAKATAATLNAIN